MLRDYQERIVQTALDELEDYSEPFVINAFQSSGKSIMIAELVRRFGKPVLILCMSKELVEQDVAKLRALDLGVTKYSASCGQKILSNITVATIGSIYKYPEYCERYALVMVDECDSVPTDKNESMYMKFLSKLNTKLIGWTGTPFRIKQNFTRKNGDLWQVNRIEALSNFPVWGKIINGVEYDELASGGFVAPMKYWSDSKNLDPTMLKMNSTGNDYTEDSLAVYGEYHRERVAGNAISAVEKWGAKRVLVTVPNIAEAEAVAAIVKNYGIKADYLHSKMNKKDRESRVEKFKRGETRVMVQVMILNIGFDLPALDCIVFARPSRSLRIWCQTVARGIRLDPESPEKRCNIIDMGFMLEKFGGVESVKIREQDGRDEVFTKHGVISKLAVSRVNISEMQRLYGR